MSITNPRNYLFAPATRPERIAKAIGSGADAVSRFKAMLIKFSVS